MSRRPYTKFFRLVPGAPLPQRADTTLNGSLPLRAAQHCRPVTLASGYGWHFFPPIDFAVVWDGDGFHWMPGDASEWFPLTTVSIPGYEDWFAAHAPAGFKDTAPPFLAAFPEIGVLQVWTGYFASTRPHVNLLVRPPANLLPHGAYHCLEGILETDWWKGPVMSNLQFKKTDVVVEFFRHKPLFQVQPVPAPAMQARLCEDYEVAANLPDISVEEWQDYRSALFPGGVQKTSVGLYGKESRKRARRTGS